MKEKKKVIIALSLILALALGNILWPTRIFSSKENRYLQEFPEINYKNILGGKFSGEFEKFTTDQFIFRDAWISLKTLGDLSLLKKDNSRIYFGKDGYLFDLNEDFSKEDLDKNINYINRFLGKIDMDRIGIDLVLIPGKSAVLAEKLPKYAPVLDEKYIKNQVEKGLSGDIHILDLTDRLKTNSNEYIYYRTDHHWTSKGAYFAYQKYMETIGQIPLPQDQFVQKLVAEDFWGTNYRKANFYKGMADQIHIYEGDNRVKSILVNGKEEISSLYDSSFLSKLDKYSYFLGGDKALMEIESMGNKNNNLLILKDSFANSLIPFLTNHFEKIVVVDPRYYKGSIYELIEDKEINQVLLLFNVENFADRGRFLPLGN